nr:uncharacterized protein LOC120967343 [Aegilops tauschii subsp. strangulata]
MSGGRVLDKVVRAGAVLLPHPLIHPSLFRALTLSPSSPPPKHPLDSPPLLEVCLVDRGHLHHPSMENKTLEMMKKAYEKCCDIASISLAVDHEKIVAERQLGIKRELEEWFKSNDEENAAMMDFNKYPLMEEPSDLTEKKVFRRLVKEKQKILNELHEMEYACIHSLATEIFFSMSKEELRELVLRKPGQVIGWAITQGMSEIPERRARWAWFGETKGVLENWAGSSDFQLKPNPDRDSQIKRLIWFKSFFPL